MPDSVLLDTNVAIYLATDHSLASRYRVLIEGRKHVLSFASAAELIYTSFRAKESHRVSQFWRAWFPLNIVPSPDLETCDVWAQISAHCHRRGRPREHNDLWIAAIALRYDIPVVTHNVRDFIDIPSLTILSDALPRH